MAAAARADGTSPPFRDLGARRLDEREAARLAVVEVRLP
jgi:hypothetical protein